MNEHTSFLDVACPSCKVSAGTPCWKIWDGRYTVEAAYIHTPRILETRWTLEDKQKAKMNKLSEALEKAYSALHDVQWELEKLRDKDNRKKAVEMIDGLDEIHKKHFPDEHRIYSLMKRPPPIPR